VATNFTEAVALIASYVATFCKMCSFLVLYSTSLSTHRYYLYFLYVKYTISFSLGTSWLQSVYDT